jgi:asparagine synthase (glutamine-hydrolysing)
VGGIGGFIDQQNPLPNASEVMSAMVQGLTRFDASRASVRTGQRSGLATAANGRIADTYADGAGGFAAIVGLPRFPQAAASGPTGPAATVLAGYRDRGRRVLDQVKGQFALAVIDEPAREALLATDRLGIEPLVLGREAGGGLIFGTSSSVVNCHPRAPRELRPQALFDFLYFHVTPGPGRAYRDQYWLLPGEFAHWQAGKLTIDRYWTMEYVEDERARFADLREQFRDLLRRAVERASKGAAVGAFLSGGTDSSTVAGVLGEVSEGRARTYSIGFEVAGFDEMDFARITARHFATDHHEYYVTPDDVVTMVPRIAAVYDAPFANASTVPAYYCAKMAREDGIERLLGGDGGDELFAGNERYATQRVFEWYQHLPAALRHRVIESALLNRPGLDGLWPLRKARSYVQQARITLPRRLQTYNILYREQIDRILTPDFLARVDPQEPEAHMESVFRGARAASPLNRMLALDLKITLADNDLPKVSRMCELAGTGVAYPLLDDDIVEFSARLAPRLKLKGLKLRWFFKEALRGFLADETLDKRKHGFGLPVGPWTLSHQPLRELSGDSLSALKTRNIVRPEFIDTIWDERLPEHPVYYGAIVWLLVSLEQWLEHHAPRWGL